LLRLPISILFFALFSYSSTALSDDLQDNESTETSKHQGIYDAASSLDFELAALVGGIAYLGIAEWDWGSASFSLNDEGFFGMDTGSGGADKLGHLYSAYLIDEYLTSSLYEKSGDRQYAAYNAALFSWGLMMFVELFDGYSSDHGFSYEDVIMNTTGIVISYLRNTIPQLNDKLDLRIEYHPSKGMKGFHPITDYSGLRYSAALRLSGFDKLKDTSMKYFELQLGYHARGFKKEDAPYFDKRLADVYVGLGLNLSELLFKPAKKYWQSKVIDYSDTILRYYQLPGTYLRYDVNERTATRR
jgi:hypothetical protein